MKTLLFSLTLTVTLAAVTACEAPTGVSDIDSPEFSVIGNNPVGAIVLNKGEASEPFTGTCFFAGRVTNDVTVIRNPNGRGLLSCHWSEFLPAPAPQSRAVVISGFGCTLNFFGNSFTTKSHFVLAKSGVANMHCTFEDVL